MATGLVFLNYRPGKARKVKDTKEDFREGEGKVAIVIELLINATSKKIIYHESDMFVILHFSILKLHLVRL